jgi:glycerophosphodiester phosphodiesterase
MKFSNRYRQHIVVAWESHYIPYQQLKASLKVANRNGYEPSKGALHQLSQFPFLTPTDLYSSLELAITDNIEFSQKRYFVLQHDEEHLEDLWNSPAFAKHRLGLIYLSLMSLQDSLVELSWFYRANHEAMDRIYTQLLKSSQACSLESDYYQQNIRENLAEHTKAYRQCVDLLDKVQARVATYQKDKSASRVNTHSLDQDYQMITAVSHESVALSIVQCGHGGTPLHFGATYGMVNLCMHALSEANPAEKIILHKDIVGFTPLETSVARGHIEVTRLLLSAMDQSPALIPDDLLHIALRHQDDAMVNLLVSRSVGLRYKSSSGESCLYIAAQLGRGDYLRLLLPVIASEFIEVAESARKWTPLFIGCVEGHVSIVKLLLDAGADPTRLDYLGWTAQENAAYRGHLPVAEIFPAINVTARFDSCLSSRDNPERKKASTFETNPGLANLVLNLGGLQAREISKSSTLDLRGIHGHGLVLSISTSESPASFERTVPLFDDPVDDTFIFAVKHPEEASIIFNIRREDTKRDEVSAIVGTGVAFLYAQTTCLGERHGTLLREQTVPILCKETMAILGTITFSFLIVGPYHKLGSLSPSVKCFEASSSTRLVGHRGAYFSHTGI